MSTLFDSGTDERSEASAISHLRYHKTIGVAVCGDVKITELETEIIDTPEFQRLRRIQQLGSCSWVYPTAVHTRFDHSLGVLQMTDRMIGAINESMLQVGPKSSAFQPRRYSVTSQQRILARLVALLHDVTHVPYGHTLEDELRIFGSHDNFDRDKVSDGRERFNILVGENSSIGKAIINKLGHSMYERMISIILDGKNARLRVDDEEGERFDEFIYHLVSDTVCGDLIDYIDRDSFFCNLDIAVGKRFLDYIYVTDVKLEEDGGDEVRRVVVRLWKPRDQTPRYDIMTDLVTLLDARYQLTERVYFHHTKITTAVMIGRAAQEAMLIGALSSVQMLKYGDATFLDYLIHLNERVSATTLKTHRKTIELVKSLASAVEDRRLYRRIKSYPKEEFGISATENCYKELIDTFSSATRRREIENNLAKVAGVSEGEVLLYVASPSMNRKIARAVVDYGGSRTLLKDVNEPTLTERLKAIEKSHYRLWKADILVHPKADEKKQNLIRLAFEAQFLRSDRAEGAFSELLNALAAEDESLSGHGRAEIHNACRLAAKDLVVGNREFGHSGNPRDLLMGTLRQILDSTKM